MTNLENMKDGQIVEKKMLNLVVSKPENDNLRPRAAIKIELEFGRKQKHSFFADTKLQVDQNYKKQANLNKPFFILKSNLFKSRNDHKVSSKKIDSLIWHCLGSC